MDGTQVILVDNGAVTVAGSLTVDAAYTISAGARCVISASLSVTQWYAQQVTFTQQEEPCQN